MVNWNKKGSLVEQNVKAAGPHFGMMRDGYRIGYIEKIGAYTDGEGDRVSVMELVSDVHFYIGCRPENRQVKKVIVKALLDREVFKVWDLLEDGLGEGQVIQIKFKRSLIEGFMVISGVKIVENAMDIKGNSIKSKRYNIIQD
jgi:hypothetical protein